LTNACAFVAVARTMSATRLLSVGVPLVLVGRYAAIFDSGHFAPNELTIEAIRRSRRSGEPSSQSVLLPHDNPIRTADSRQDGARFASPSGRASASSTRRGWPLRMRCRAPTRGLIQPAQGDPSETRGQSRGATLDRPTACAAVANDRVEAVGQRGKKSHLCRGCFRRPLS